MDEEGFTMNADGPLVGGCFYFLSYFDRQEFFSYLYKTSFS